MMPPGAAMTVAQRGGRWVRAIIVLRIATGHRMLEFPSHPGASLPVAADVNAVVGATGGRMANDLSKYFDLPRWR
jgi:hypothetical protein